jgi:hypothetical protein
MEILIQDALKDFDRFKELIETIPQEVLAAEAEGLAENQQDLFRKYCDRLIHPHLGDTVQYTNPDNLESCRHFEHIDLKIDRIWRGGGDGTGDLALCTLPDGSQETFKLKALSAAKVHCREKKCSAKTSDETHFA